MYWLLLLVPRKHHQQQQRQKQRQTQPTEEQTKIGKTYRLMIYKLTLNSIFCCVTACSPRFMCFRFSFTFILVVFFLMQCNKRASICTRKSENYYRFLIKFCACLCDVWHCSVTRRFCHLRLLSSFQLDMFEKGLWNDLCNMHLVALSPSLWTFHLNFGTQNNSCDRFSHAHDIAVSKTFFFLSFVRLSLFGSILAQCICTNYIDNTIIA